MKPCDGDPSPINMLFRYPARSPPETCGGWPEESSRFLRDYVAWEFNAFCWISLLAVTFILSFRVFKLFKLWFQARKLPGPPCDSFSGHCQLLSGENLTDVLSTSHKKYGSVIKLWLGPTSLLVSIKDPELIREVLLKAKDKLPLTRKAFRMAFGPSSLFASSFDKVAERRQLLATELNKRLIDKANVLPTKLLDSIMEQLNDNTVEGSIDCKVVSRHMAFTLLGTMLFGEAFLVWSKATIYEEILMMIVKDACLWASYSVTPFWKREFWRYQRLCRKLKYLTQDILQQCRKSCKLLSQADESLHDKPVHARVEYSSAVPKRSGLLPDNFSPKQLSGHPDAREERSGSVMGLMFHGFLTTAGLIDNILARLVAHPEIQNRIHSEIVAARKASAKQEEHNVHSMHLLLATIYESARLLPAGPLLQRCSPRHDLRLKNGMTIPAGAVVVVPVQLVQTDHSSWGSDATEFNPYRFLSRASDRACNSSLTDSEKDERETSLGPFVMKDPKENIAFLPFGSGTRSCLGEKFVIQGVARLFASLLEHYEIKIQLDSKQKKKPTPVIDNYLLRLAPSPDIVFIPRDS